MEVWAPGGAVSFENDAAMDWAAEVQSIDDVRKPLERLKRGTDAYVWRGDLASMRMVASCRRLPTVR